MHGHGSPPERFGLLAYGDVLGLAEAVWIRECQGITGNENNRVYRKTSNYKVHNEGYRMVFPSERAQYFSL